MSCSCWELNQVFSAVQRFILVTVLTTPFTFSFSSDVEEFCRGLLPGADPVPVWSKWEPQKFPVRIVSLRDKIRYVDLQNMKQKFSSDRREFNP